jgi:hypothetical protein
MRDLRPACAVTKSSRAGTVGRTAYASAAKMNSIRNRLRSPRTSCPRPYAARVPVMTGDDDRAVRLDEKAPSIPARDFSFPGQFPSPPPQLPNPADSTPVGRFCPPVRAPPPGVPSCVRAPRARLPSWGRPAHLLRSPVMTDRDPPPDDNPVRRRARWASPSTGVS